MMIAVCMDTLLWWLKTYDAIIIYEENISLHDFVSITYLSTSQFWICTLTMILIDQLLWLLPYLVKNFFFLKSQCKIK